MTTQNNAFARSRALFALAMAAMQLPTGARQAALANIPEYRSNGKRKTAAHPARMYRISQRAALKKRNQRRNRLAHRG